jgi:hypothetical protein
VAGTSADSGSITADSAPQTADSGNPIATVTADSGTVTADSGLVTADAGNAFTADSGSLTADSGLVTADGGTPSGLAGIGQIDSSATGSIGQAKPYRPSKVFFSVQKKSPDGLYWPNYPQGNRPS